MEAAPLHREKEKKFAREVCTNVEHARRVRCSARTLGVNLLADQKYEPGLPEEICQIIMLADIAKSVVPFSTKNRFQQKLRIGKLLRRVSANRILHVSRRRRQTAARRCTVTAAHPISLLTLVTVVFENQIISVVGRRDERQMGCAGRRKEQHLVGRHFVHFVVATMMRQLASLDRLILQLLFIGRG
uniref:Uncharacterized protein n=1 Tax=Romanomermis culicivorax TaxID=13658 RepID=A0A915KFF6_ROMCU